MDWNTKHLIMIEAASHVLLPNSSACQAMMLREMKIDQM